MMPVHEAFFRSRENREVTLELLAEDARRLFDTYRGIAIEASYTESVDTPYSTLKFTFGPDVGLPVELERTLRGILPDRPAVPKAVPGKTPRTAWEWISDPVL